MEVKPQIKFHRSIITINYPAFNILNPHKHKNLSGIKKKGYIKLFEDEENYYISKSSWRDMDHALVIHKNKEAKRFETVFNPIKIDNYNKRKFWTIREKNILKKDGEIYIKLKK